MGDRGHDTARRRALRGVVFAIGPLVFTAAVATPVRADPDSDGAWSPDYSVFPYNLWQVRVTPEQVIALRESCQWFNVEYDALIAEVLGFQRLLGDERDDWRAAGVSSAADAVTASARRSAAFLEPRGATLYIVNYPDQSRYSPLYHGDSVYHLWYQITRIIDKIDRRVPSGQLNANSATALVYGNAIRQSAVCDGAER